MTGNGRHFFVFGVVTSSTLELLSGFDLLAPLLIAACSALLVVDVLADALITWRRA